MKQDKNDVDKIDKLVLGKLIVNKLKYIKGRRYNDKLIDDLNLIFKVFLLKYLNLDYEFTDGELSIELRKARISPELKNRILLMSNLFVNIRYKNIGITKDEFTHYLFEIEDIAVLCTGYDKKRLKPDKKKTDEKNLLNSILIYFNNITKNNNKKYKNRKKKSNKLGKKGVKNARTK